MGLDMYLQARRQAYNGTHIKDPEAAILMEAADKLGFPKDREGGTRSRSILATGASRTRSTNGSWIIAPRELTTAAPSMSDGHNCRSCATLARI